MYKKKCLLNCTCVLSQVVYFFYKVSYPLHFVSVRLLFVYFYIFRRVHINYKKTINNFVMSVCLAGRVSTLNNSAPNRLIFMKLDTEIFSKICGENSIFSETWQESPVLYVKTNIHFGSYLAQFFLWWEMFQTEVIEKIKTRWMLSRFFFSKIVHLWDKVENYFRGGRANGIKWLLRIACCLP